MTHRKTKRKASRGPGPLPRIEPRRIDAHKGDFGRVLVVAGSPRMTGAAVLAGDAALRAGAGLVTLAVPRSIHAIVASRILCETTLSLPAAAGSGALAAQASRIVLDALDRASALAIGPGLGLERGTVACVRAILDAATVPSVVDADGLNAIAPDLARVARRNGRAPLVLTPHPGEMGRLLGIPIRDVERDREGAARRAARAAHAIVVLKGHRSVVTDGTRLAINGTGNPGMATGGTGDVLTGVVAALLGQGFDPFDAARLGAHVHGLAGDIAAKATGEISLVAADLLASLPAAFRALATRRRGRR